MKERLIATVVTFIAWFGLNYLFHNLFLMPDYELTAQLWRPKAEMNCVSGMLSSLLAALAFVFTYCRMVKDKTQAKGTKLGFLVGIIVGIGAGLGSYSYMPITEKIAIVWFIANVANFTVAGAITGYFVKKEA